MFTHLRLLIILPALAGFSCSTQQKLDYTILEYNDFGPQAMAHELIGMNWWQWLEPGGFEPSDTFDIQVIVYCDGRLLDIERRFPVDKTTQKDYRYITKNDAIDYLNGHIKEDLSYEVTQQLVATKQTIDSTITCDQ